MNIFETLINKPFGYVLDFLYQITNNYGYALIIFAVFVYMVLMPITAKSKKSMMKMSRLTPRMQEIQKKYADDPQRQQQAINDLYRNEGVSMGGGCLWSLVPMLILIPLYQVVRQPIVYMLHETLENANEIVRIIKEANPDLFTGNSYYDQMVAARHIADYAEAIKAAGVEVSARTLEGLRFDFLSFGSLGAVDLGAIPQWNILSSTWVWDWPHIGAALIPVISAGSQVLQMFINQKMNNSVITNEKGIQDEETAKNSQQNQSAQTMMWMMPLMSLFIGFSVPTALSLYWFVGGLVRTIQDTILTRHYRKVYDAEDAVRLQKALEEERIEAEKERIRAEKRAANPDGITENTSKKKMQKKLAAEQQAAKAAAAKEYAAKKGIVEETQEKQVMSGIPERPYCKGRNYDPNRYSVDSTEE